MNTPRPSSRSRAGRTLTALLAGLLGLLLLFVLLPSPIDPVAWEAPPHDPAAWPATGSLQDAHRVPIPGGLGPEDVDVDPQGRVLAGVADGRILRWTPADDGTFDGVQPETLADIGGHPVGLHWAAPNGPAGEPGGGALLVANADRGLQSVAPDGTVTTLATTCGGTPLGFTDDMEVADDGTIWFSDASTAFDHFAWKLDLIENRPHGRLCRLRPGVDDEPVEVLDGLHFANGVAVDPQQRFVLVNETARYRVRRYWLAGPMAGQDEILIDNLPGFPDGISAGTGGRFWIAIASPRNGLLDGLDGSPALRRQIVKLPKWAQPKPERTARVIAIDDSGAVLHDLSDPAGSALWMVTSVQERGGRLHLGSLVDDAWAWIDTP